MAQLFIALLFAHLTALTHAISRAVARLSLQFFLTTHSTPACALARVLMSRTPRPALARPDCASRHGVLRRRLHITGSIFGGAGHHTTRS